MEIGRHGPYWAVYDAAGTLVCLTVYKKGAAEVVRRLTMVETAASHLSEASSREAARPVGRTQSKARLKQQRCHAVRQSQETYVIPPFAADIVAEERGQMRDLRTLTIQIEVTFAGEDDRR